MLCTMLALYCDCTCDTLAPICQISAAVRMYIGASVLLVWVGGRRHEATQNILVSHSFSSRHLLVNAFSSNREERSVAETLSV